MVTLRTSPIPGSRPCLFYSTLNMVEIAIIVENLVILDTPYLEFNRFGLQNVPNLLHFLLRLKVIVTLQDLLLEKLQFSDHFLLEPDNVRDSLLFVVSLFGDLYLPLLELRLSMVRRFYSGEGKTWLVFEICQG